MAKNAQQTVQSLSGALEELVAGAEKASAARAEQAKKAADTLTAALTEAQQEASQIALSLARNVNARYEASLELARRFSPAAASREEPFAGPKEALEKQFALDRDLYVELGARLVSLQGLQVATAKALSAPAFAALEVNLKQSEGAIKFGGTVLQAYQAFAKELVSASFPQSAAAA